ncbi:MAG: aldo/keto reductase [Oscillospiraceae bacterium]|jgi:aryl-alcohol dehydrogenase-like predicted oxidoreductase|nr:aldo/keto reductase [Oscillospiraceae bacterium]
METTTLGRTGLRVSVGGLGGGGFSRLGLEELGEEHAAGIARAAYDGGVTFFDTAMAYGTERAVGRGLKGLPRDSFAVSTKVSYTKPDGTMISPEELLGLLDGSLTRLGMDYVDVYHIHAVTAEDYKRVSETLIPALIKARERGKIRFPGITERFFADTSHKMLPTALRDDFFDVVMTGYNILNPSAARDVLPLTREKNVAVLCMFAVRNALRDRTQLKIDIERIIAAGQGDAELLRRDGTLEFLMSSGAAGSLTEAAYRFCRHTPGITVTLTGTKNKAHLTENLAAIDMPALPDEALSRLEALFGGVDCVSGQ